MIPIPIIKIIAIKDTKISTQAYTLLLLNLPFITSIVLGEVSGLTEIGPPKSVPFFQNNDEESLFLRLQNSVK